MAQKNDLKSEKLRERNSEEIRQDIFERRESLSNTISQLGGRMPKKLNWRKQLSQHPYLAMTAATGLGFLLSGIFKPKRIIRNSFQGLFNKTGPGMVAMLSTILLQAGGNFLLSKIKKNTSDHTDHKGSNNGVHNEETTHEKK